MPGSAITHRRVFRRSRRSTRRHRKAIESWGLTGNLVVASLSSIPLSYLNATLGRPPTQQVPDYSEVVYV
jgi:hypothetical protein